jgi:hypothetical protein
MTELRRVFNQPAYPPVYAWVGAAGDVRSLATFPDPRDYPGDQLLPDGTRCLPVYGNEPPIDLERQYFMDDYKVDGDRVVRTRTVHDVPPRG